MVIVEGPDGSGKSTLIKRLQQDMPYLELQPRVVSKDAESMVDLQKWVIEDLQKGKGPRLYDRHRLISELIYGPVLRKTMEPGFDDPLWLATKLTRFENLMPVVIMCLPPIDIVTANVMRSQDNRVVYDDITTIYWLYYIWYVRAKMPNTWLWDYTKSDADAHYQRMVNYIHYWVTGELYGAQQL